MHLIQVVLVVGVLAHALQRLQHLGSIAPAHRLGLLYAGVELQLIGRILLDGLVECFVGLLLVA